MGGVEYYDHRGAARSWVTPILDRPGKQLSPSPYFPVAAMPERQLISSPRKQVLNDSLEGKYGHTQQEHQPS